MRSIILLALLSALVLTLVKNNDAAPNPEAAGPTVAPAATTAAPATGSSTPAPGTTAAGGSATPTGSPPTKGTPKPKGGGAMNIVANSYLYTFALFFAIMYKLFN